MTEAKYPFHYTADAGPLDRDWWPSQLKLDILRQLRVARPGRGPCRGGCAAEVRRGLRGGLEQGDEPGSLRPGVMMEAAKTTQ